MAHRVKIKRRLAALMLAAVCVLTGPAGAYASGGPDQAAAPAPAAQEAPVPQQGDLTAQTPPAAQPQAPAAEAEQPGASREREGSFFRLPDDGWQNDPTAKVSAPAQLAPAADASALDLPCRNAILVNLDTGTVLYELEADTRVPIASITKVMTLLLTMEAVEQGKAALTDIVPVSEHAYNMGGSQIWLEPGEQFTLDEMIKAICISSANDAAVAVAEYIGGSEPVFAEMMNARAQQLGMTNTHFVNACGLDEEGHYSSARDVAVMSRELMRHPKILEYTGIWMDSLRNGQTQLVNTNKLLRTYQGATGLKTGTTSGAGVCIAASATRDNMGLLAVVLGAASSAERFEAARQLLDFGFAGWQVSACPEVAGRVQALPVRGGTSEQVALSYRLPEKLLTKRSQAQALTAQLELPERLEAPVQAGQQVGQVQVLSDGQLLGTWPVTAAGSVDVLDFGAALSLLTKALFTL